MKEELPVGDKAVDELVSQVKAARVDKDAGADVGAPSGDKAGAKIEAIFVAGTGAARVDQAAAAIATAHRLSKAAADQQDAARVAKAGAEVDAAGNVSMSDDDFEDDNDPLNLQKQYLQGCPRPELKRLATEAGLNLKGNAKKPTLVKSLLAHYTKLVAQVGYTNPCCAKCILQCTLKCYLK